MTTTSAELQAWSSSSIGAILPPIKDIPATRAGIVGDGVVDEWQAFQRVLDFAAAEELGVINDAPTSILSVTVYFLSKGIKRLVGGVYEFDSVGNAGIYTKSDLNGYSSADELNGFEMRDVTMNFSDTATLGYGLRGYNCRNVKVHNCTINGIEHGYGVLFLMKGSENIPANIDIAGNTFDGYITSEKLPIPYYSIGVAATYGYADGQTTQAEQWINLKTVAHPEYLVEGVSIYGNDVTGGYYSVSMIGLRGAKIFNNICTMNARNISMQTSCTDCHVYRNDLSDSTSSGIHLAFGSSGNLIEYNDIDSSRAIGEGLLQAYVDCHNNTYRYNDITVTSETGPKFYIYCGLHSGGNSFSHNTITGPVLRAGVAIESSWNTDDPQLWSYARGISTDFDGYASDGYTTSSMAGNVVDNNVIDVDSDTMPALVINQDSDADNGAVPLGLVTLTNNSFTGTTREIIVRETATGYLVAPTLSGNTGHTVTEIEPA